MALIQLVNDICSAVDYREPTAGVFLDLSKAFDTIDFYFIILPHIINYKQNRSDDK